MIHYHTKGEKRIRINRERAVKDLGKQAKKEGEKK